MAVLVRVNSDGLEIDVPACEGDGIARFDIAWPHANIDSRWSESAPTRRRIITLDATEARLADGDFNPEETEVIFRSRSTPDTLTGSVIFLSTEKGFAEWSADDISPEQGTTWIVKGRAEPTPVAPGTALPLADMCAENRP